MALRIVVPSIKDCYAALGIIHQTWSPVPGRIKDFIAMPRPNGYQSLHTSVVSERGFPFEVQIRTAEMHRVAEEGIAAHWKYKEGRHGAARDEQYFVWLRQLLEFQQEVRDPQEFLQNLKIELYPEEVYIFTPAGEVKALPRDATPVDFAYAIHTDVGHQCVGARVNGKMVPLRTRLRNGDIVQVMTTPGHNPSRDWLNFVVTSRARNKIKHYIHAEEKSRSLDLGKKVFEKEARRYGLNPKTLTEGDAFAKVLAEYGYSKAEELLVAVGYGKLAVKSVLGKLVPQEQLKEAPETPGPIAQVANAVRRVLGPTEEKIKVRGFDDLMVFRARCCNPIRGEKIVGYITRGKGVSVHSAACPNVVNLLYDPDRKIDVEWDKGTDVAPYTVRLSLQVEDRKGILADVTSKIAGINTNIRNVEATSDADQHGRIDMTVEISDVKHLQKVIKSLRSVDGVVDVERAPR
jgi:GTP pyrophosphokinase